MVAAQANRLRVARRQIHWSYAVIFYVHCALPVASVLFALLAAIAASAELGHWPYRWRNDPNGLGPIVQFLSAAWGISLLAFLASIFTGALAIPIYAYHRWGFAPALLVALAYCASIFGAWAFFAFDPFDVIEWLTD